MKTLDAAIAHSVRVLPRGIVSRVAGRYIAGERLGAAIDVMARLVDEGCTGTLDVLGEHIHTAEAAQGMCAAYEAALNELADRGLPAGVSVKLTSLGLSFDRELCASLLDRVLAAAAPLGRFVRVDMEESEHTGATLDMVLDAKRRGFRVGAVIQTRLRRSPADVERLIESGVPVRLVKGIYLEPARIAFTSQEDIRDAFVALLRRLVEGTADIALGTHDDVLVDRSLAEIEKAHLPRERYEFQMLLGVRPELRRRLLREGHRVRVYVPFGEDWFAYSVRRLQENPRMATLIAKAILKPN
jgi:proline dehydrogenase